MLLGIDVDILFAWGATSKKYKKGDFIFNEGDIARFYYQVVEGTVKLFNMNDDGKEFTQGVFSDGDCFGDPPMILNTEYPSTAVVVKNSIIIKLSRENLFKILDEYRDVERAYLHILAKRMLNKSITAKEIINNNPEQRILGFLNAYCKDQNLDGKIPIPFTRQEIANFTGLRVETVIRTLKKMCEQRKVEIEKHKLYYNK